MHIFLRIFRSYKLLAALSSMIFTLSVLLIMLGVINSAMENSITDMKRTANLYRPGDTKARLNELEAALSTINPPYLTAVDAKRLLLETLENFRTLYNGKILNDITDSGGSYSAELEFEIEPTNPAQIAAIVNYMENSAAPVITVKKLTFLKSQDKNTVRFLISADQPYYGGVYEY